MEIRQTELLRYLGWKGQEFDETLQNKIKEAEGKLAEAEEIKKRQFEMLERISGLTIDQAKE